MALILVARAICFSGTSWRRAVLVPHAQAPKRHTRQEAAGAILPGVPLRRLFQMAEDGFHDTLPSNNGRLLIATGLEGSLDVLSAEDAEAWTISAIQPVVGRFQEAWDGSGALAFWLPSGATRIVERPASAAYDWRLPTGHEGRTLRLSELIFSGADDDLQRIMAALPDGRTECVGLYHPRVS